MSQILQIIPAPLDAWEVVYGRASDVEDVVAFALMEDDDKYRYVEAVVLGDTASGFQLAKDLDEYILVRRKAVAA